MIEQFLGRMQFSDKQEDGVSWCTQRTESRHSSIRVAIGNGLAYLEERQRKNGAWFEFVGRGRCGKATTWPTAWVTYFLASVGQGSGLVARACTYLEGAERRGGWGFNRLVPCDLDSTAWAVLALSSQEGALSKTDRDRLAVKIIRYRDHSQFHLYRSGVACRAMCLMSRNLSYRGWCSPQLEVTAVAISALAALGLGPEDLGDVWKDPNSGASSDRTRSYWWAEDYYLLAVLWLAAARWPVPKDVMTPVEQRLLGETIPDQLSAQSLALLVFASHQNAHPLRSRSSLVDELLRRQHVDGSWRSGAILRIPAASSREPWKHRVWRIDQPGPWALWSESDHTLSTSAAVAALSSEVHR